MAAKFCINCEFHKRMPYQTKDRGMMIDVCTNENYGDPVNGQPLPCQVVRQERALCGMTGAGFVKRKTPDPDNPEKTRILTAT